MSEITEHILTLKNPQESEGVETEIKIESIVRDLLILLGEDPSREGLLKTPKRVESSLKFLTRGYKQDVERVLNGAIFEEKEVKYSVCLRS